MAGLNETQKRMAQERARMLENRVEAGSGDALYANSAPAVPAGGGISQAQFTSGRRPSNDKQLAALLKKRMAEDEADRKARGE